MKIFLQDIMPDMKPNFVYSEEAFDELFNEFDEDRSGKVTKEEMTAFIERFLRSDPEEEDRAMMFSEGSFAVDNRDHQILSTRRSFRSKSSRAQFVRGPVLNSGLKFALEREQFEESGE